MASIAPLYLQDLFEKVATDSFNDLGVKVIWTDNYDEGFPSESSRSATSTVIRGLRRKDSAGLRTEMEPVQTTERWRSGPWIGMLKRVFR